ncbi:MAG: methyltransferase, partial [Ferruginibacter sp.]
MNTYFQFKQFTIHQDKCAMKVCTDACLLGAWVANKFYENNIIANNILDIGCGTGLLSLMLAQKTAACINAIEIDEDAFLQANENIEASVFKNRIKVINTNAVNYNNKEKFDFIICNPPFFENQLKSDDVERNKAMHCTTLSFNELSKTIKNNIANSGKAAILLPYESVIKFEKIINTYNLFIVEQLNINHSPKHPFFRSIILISYTNNNIVQQEMFIKDNAGIYSDEFTFLLKDY